MTASSFAILLHSSKTMRMTKAEAKRQPLLTKKSKELGMYLKSLKVEEIARVMRVSPKLAGETRRRIQEWQPNGKSIAIDSFIGDIYSGLHANELSETERAYADEVLWILSGLYGVLRPFDGISPYRLEMEYKLPDARYKNLYDFWGDAVASQMPKGIIVNASSVEYSRVVTKYIDPARVITPQFFTIDQRTGRPAFKTVHTKIARGAFARWLIQTQYTKPEQFHKFDDLGYAYDPKLSTFQSPAFVSETFGGIGLSIRLS